MADALKKVITRNEFYRDNFRRLALILLVSFLLNVILVGVLIVGVFNQPKPVYFGISQSGQLIKLHPRSEPLLTDGQVRSWVSQAVPQIYSLDFMNYRTQLLSVRKYFTSFGWNNFLQAFSGQLNNIKSNKYVTRASTTDQPVVIGSGTIDGVYTWKVQVPIRVTFSKAGEESTQEFVWQLVIQRQNADNRELVGISQIVQTNQNQ